MAGHSKWANIKHRKGRQDAKRGKIFSRLIRELTVASRLGGPVAEDNPRLRTALDKALSANMPKDTIERAIQRGSGSAEGDDLEETTFEGYGPGGVAIIVESMTDNNNRTVAEVRHAFSKAGGNLGTDGSVSYLFIKKGLIQLSNNTSLEQVLEVAIEAGAEDIEENSDQSITISTLPEDFDPVKKALIDKEIETLESEISLVPETSVSTDLETSIKIYKLLEALEDLDDTQNVHSNADFPEEIVEHLD
ncbi:MAG TPA: YebC/PmpR family DNA-binding transcriptional regulator [Gammaproteobacteria bacterium]|jgi:YebC/PmpR family DNA-binding regulatory protein|nr:YebC/PmpR family DNA-binding transcriptional regulator [Gammaproteobacteria bacterium]HIA43682.1 YebC/PmpR family DNA-binding transcriptional regulator [Gammaproteobacteria bacterium]HIA96490.1 YebC/PmpR family DNA-binding transcriptional regulator [Gammaproteobacteria bacterium]HIB74632.1 YebC/PmpR family DNA-binding transcriptional regulator [Gammaproteobacteria bacterium]HIG49265.1 YebC/PmpR family DNA-binding transcriptional regulator [Gammaproteobacteria bacterium]